MVCLACRGYSDRQGLVRHQPTRALSKFNATQAFLKTFPCKKKRHQARKAGTKTYLEATDGFFLPGQADSRGRPRQGCFIPEGLLRSLLSNIRPKYLLFYVEWSIFKHLISQMKLWFSCIYIWHLISTLNEKKMNLKGHRIKNVNPSIRYSCKQNYRFQHFGKFSPPPPPLLPPPPPCVCS